MTTPPTSALGINIRPTVKMVLTPHGPLPSLEVFDLGDDDPTERSAIAPGALIEDDRVELAVEYLEVIVKVP